jgi:hypothetical protein
MCRRCQVIILLLVALTGWMIPQEVAAQQERRERLYDQHLQKLIKDKIEYDVRNTNLLTTGNLSAEDLADLRTVTLRGASDDPFTFKRSIVDGSKTGGNTKTDYFYSIEFLGETPSRPLQLMRISEVKVVTLPQGAGTQGAMPETSRTWFNLEDILTAEGRIGNRQPETAALIPIQKVLGNLERKGKIQAKRQTTGERGPLASDESNREYIWSARVNDHHPFADLNDPDSRPLVLDLTFSSLAISHKSLYVGSESIGIHGFGFEAGFGDRVLNHVSFQSPMLSWGPRFLIFFKDAGEGGVDTSFFVDLRILGRTPMNTASFINSWRLHVASPVMSLDPPRLNVTSGVTFEVMTGLPYSRMPFLTFRYSGGSREFQSPYVRFGEGDSSFAYYSTRQWEGALSYFWAMDKAAFNRLRFDFGAGTYDVRRVLYTASGAVSNDVKARAMSQVQPLLALTYTHVSRRARFGAQVRMFDNRLTFSPWLKVFRSGLHEFRLEAVLMPRPVGRSLREWEVDHGNLVQVRYRYGFETN